MASSGHNASEDHLRLLAEEMVLELASVSDVLRQVACAAAASAGRSCGITYRTSYGVVTVASSDALANSVDEMQYTTGDGPCLEAMRTGRPVQVDDISTERRWGAYPAMAAGAGVRSSLSYPILIKDESVGALNIYARIPAQWGPDEVAEAIVLSSQAGGILDAVRGVAEDLTRDPISAQALNDRHETDIAVGIRMAQRGCSEVEAFDGIDAEAARRRVTRATVVMEIISGLRGDRT